MTETKEDVKRTVKRLREEGKTYEQIGRILKITRQRAHQLYKELLNEDKQN